MAEVCVYQYQHVTIISLLPHTHHTLSNTDSTELNASVPDEVKPEHFEMNTNDAYGSNTAEIATIGNVAYMTTGDTILATQNVAYRQVPPGTDECYDYVI